MADSWQTIEQAAVSLRMSVRTVNRHIVAGKIQSRLTDGRREVLVDLSGGAGAGLSQESGGGDVTGRSADCHRWFAIFIRSDLVTDRRLRSRYRPRAGR